jgi:hypothetical protein
MIESTILKSVMLSCSRGATRLFRNNVGKCWIGNVIKQWTADGKQFITLENPRRFHAGLCTGSLDLIGWKSVTITPDMVGQTLAVFVAIETKTKTGRATTEQNNFISAVRKAGGLAGVARSDAEALAILDIRQER